MDSLKQKILDDGKVIGSNILKVDSFINHQIDTKMLDEIGSYIAAKFDGVTKIVTIETSGIAFACSVARHYNFAPVVFAKKAKSEILKDDVYETKVYSFTKKQTFNVYIDKRFLNKDDKILIVDDFLADGNACFGLIDLCNQAEANIIGIGIVVEKGFQPGHSRFEEAGYKVESCATVLKLENGCVTLK